MEYNVDREKLIIPEYGRHVQKMINHCVLIKNDEERNKCANAIIFVMGNMNPHLRDIPDFQHKLWDQLFIMSNFKLNVNSPYPIPTAEQFQEAPRRLKYPEVAKKYRYYGHNIKKMIDIAISWEDGDKKEALIYTIANHMKKCFLKWNKDTVDDEIVWNHLDDLSDGRLVLKGETEGLVSFESQEKNYQRHSFKKRRKTK
ncbi:MAG: DUF4290 domain-containing protein [Flavobacteriales bacterium]